MRILVLLVLFIALPTMLLAQEHVHAQHNSLATLDVTFWFGLLELPFLFVCIYFAFKTASALKGGVFGKGMKLMAWGFLVMAVGHMHMQFDHLMGYNLFNSLLGYVAGNVVWFIALVITWSLSGLGFYSIYKASSQK